MLKTSFWAVVTVCTISSACPSPCWAWKSGAPAAKNGSVASDFVSCRDCHSGEEGPGGVEIIGAPLQYEPDVLYELIVRVSDVSQLGAGFQISVEDPKGTHVGALILSDELRTYEAPGAPGWVTHTLFGIIESVQQWEENEQAAEYTLSWRAPSEPVGELTFYAAGNAINDSGQPEGDHIYLTSVVSTPLTCESDANGDGEVDPLDSGYVQARFNCTVGAGDPECDAADINADLVVDPLDAGYVLARFGPCP